MKHICINQAKRRGAWAGGMLVALTLNTVFLAGCSSDTQTKMSESDKANFKGGPMPADYKDHYMSGKQSSANQTGPSSQTK